MRNNATFKLTVFFEDRFWVGIFERNLEGGYSVAKHIFGSEPSEPELYDFLLKHTNMLNFTTPNSKEKQLFKKQNPKRMKREVSREMNKQKSITKAQATIKKEHTENKSLKKHKSSEKKREEASEKFVIKQLKKKEKIRGH